MLIFPKCLGFKLLGLEQSPVVYNIKEDKNESTWVKDTHVLQKDILLVPILDKCLWVAKDKTLHSAPIPIGLGSMVFECPETIYSQSSFFADLVFASWSSVPSRTQVAKMYLWAPNQYSWHFCSLLWACTLAEQWKLWVTWYVHSQLRLMKQCSAVLFQLSHYKQLTFHSLFNSMLFASLCFLFMISLYKMDLGVVLKCLLPTVPK